MPWCILSAFKHPLPWELCDQCVLKNISFFLNKNPSLTWSGSQNLLLYSLAICVVFLPFHENSMARMCRMITTQKNTPFHENSMQWDLLPYSSAICSVFGSPCPARSSSLAHPLLPGHVVGRRDDDVVRTLENFGKLCWRWCFAKKIKFVQTRITSKVFYVLVW